MKRKPIRLVILVLVTVALATTAAWVSVKPEPQTEIPDYPYISGVSDHSYEIFLTGQALGNRANVFAKVGDSLTKDSRFLSPIGQGRYKLYEYAYLEPMIDYYSQEKARTANSFVNETAAAGNGWRAWSVFTGTSPVRGICHRGEAPLTCEYRLVQPAVALIMLGTNDAASGTSLSVYETQMRRIIETSEANGVIPILSTIPPLNRRTKYSVEQYNEVIRRLAAEYDVPLIDYWAALQGLPGYGLSRDGVHPWAPYNAAADFSPENLATAGITVRNLLTLQALDEVWRFIQASSG